MNRIKKFFQTTESRNGSYSVGITVLVLVIVIILNLIVGQLPEKIRNIDVSSTKIYEITDTSKDLLKKLDQDVTMTVLADKSDTDERIKTFLSKYSALSNHISVKWIDPVLHPSALNEYQASENSIVVSCEETGKTTTVSFDDIIVMDQASYYYTGTATEAEFDGEGQLTSAVNYVTTTENHTIYRTAGHGESTFSTTISDLMDKSNDTVTELNTVMDASIPEDCDLLLMYAPTTDLSETEVSALETYLQKGGKMMVILGDKEKEELPNLEALMKTYGLEMADGYIADTQRNYQGNYYYIFPELSLDSDLSSGISSEMVLVINSHGLTQIDPARDTITTTPFMTTSQGGYAVTEDAQTEGTYVLGAVATESVTDAASADAATSDSAENAEDTEATSETDTSENTASEVNTTQSRLTVIASASLIDPQVTDSFSTLENSQLFMNAVTANFDNTQNISIEPKSLTAEYNSVQHGGLLSILVIFVLPAAVLISGLVVWIRRRRA